MTTVNESTGCWSDQGDVSLSTSAADRRRAGAGLWPFAPAALWFVYFLGPSLFSQSPPYARLLLLSAVPALSGWLFVHWGLRRAAGRGQTRRHGACLGIVTWLLFIVFVYSFFLIPYSF